VIAELVRLQTAVGPSRVRRRADAARALGPHLAARHRALQQVSVLTVSACRQRACLLFPPPRCTYKQKR